MKALLYKEFKLAMHPICYLFIFVFPFMMLIPSYPLGVGFIYLLACYPLLFLGANKGQQSNDLLYSTLLPVRKKDIVLARIITVLCMQFTFIAIMSLLFPIAKIIQYGISADISSENNELISHIPGLGLDAFVSVLGIAILGFAIADMIFFPIYYKNGKSIVMSTLLTILGFVIYIGWFTIAMPYLSKGYASIFSGNIGIQFGILAGCIIISALFHFIIYKTSSKKLEKVDF